MKIIHLFFDIFNRNSTHTAYRMGEVFIDHIFINTNGFKNLGAFIGLNGADTHFGCNLYDAVQNCIVVIVHCRIIILIQHMVVDQFLDGFLCQIGVDGACTVTKQGCEMMHLSRFPGFKDQGHARLFLGYNEMSVQCRYRKQRGDCHVVFIHAPVREDHDIHTVSVGSVHFHKQSVDGAFQTCVFIIGNRNNFYLKAILFHALDLHDIRVGQDRIMDLHHIAVLGCFLQNISVRTNVNCSGSHYLLTDGIDRRVGYLGKFLFEIMEQRVMRLA